MAQIFVGRDPARCAHLAACRANEKHNDYEVTPRPPTKRCRHGNAHYIYGTVRELITADRRLPVARVFQHHCRRVLREIHVKQPLKHLLIVFALIAAAAAAAAAAAPARGVPTVVANVHGYTLAGADLQTFTALAFEGGKVLQTGDAASLRLRYPSAQVIDGHGKTLLPGLIDAHGHVLDLGLRITEIQLTGTTSLQQAQRIVRVYAQANPQ